METSKVDKIACALHSLADSISQLDDRFADENGNIKIDKLEEVIELASMVYALVKNVYACTGKDFSVVVPGTFGKILDLIFELLDGELKKKADVKATA